MKLDELYALNDVAPGAPISIMRKCVLPRDFKVEFTMLIFFSSGYGHFEIDGRRLPIRPKSICVLRHGQSVSNMHMTPNASAEVMTLGGALEQEMSISSVFLGLFVLSEYPVLRVSLEYNDALRLFFEALTRVLKFNDNPYKDECIKSLLRALFYTTGYYLYKSLNYKADDLYRLSVDHGQNRDGIVSRFLRLVEENSSRERRLTFYAGKLGYNPKYLSSLIKRETGFSGQELIEQYAVLCAVTKLSYGGKTIGEISDEMNFPSQSDFGKFFKRMTGKSPLNYRKHK